MEATLLCAKQAGRELGRDWEAKAECCRSLCTATATATATGAGRVPLCLPLASAQNSGAGRTGQRGKVTLVPVLFANGLVEQVLKCLQKTKRTHRVARTQPISQFTPGEKGTRHTKFRNGKRQSLLAKLRH